MDYDFIMDCISSADIGMLEEIAEKDGRFPYGKDTFVERYWIVNAIDCGAIKVVKWMIEKGVELGFESEGGYSVLHNAIDRMKPDKYELVEVLVRSGADINVFGINGWTPLHMAAVYGDKKMCELLLDLGANLNLRTIIDEHATPEEEAYLAGKTDIGDLLKEYRGK